MMAIASNLFRAGVLLLVLAAQAQAQTDPTVPLEQCSVNTDPPVSVPGFDAVEEQVAVFMMGQSDNEGENGGTLNIYMNNSITVGGFQWILRCKDESLFDSEIDIDLTIPGPTLEDEDISVAANSNIVIVFALTGDYISPGFRDLFTLHVTADCPAEDICFDDATYTTPFGNMISSECGACGNPCLCEETPPLPPSPPPSLPAGVPAALGQICLDAGLTNFVVMQTLGVNVYDGTEEAECIIGTLNNDYISGGGGGDIIFGRNGVDYINGQHGPDVIYGNLGADILMGGEGNDVVYGGNGADLILGDLGDDQLFGQGGSDTLSGGPGSNVLQGGGGADLFIDCPAEGAAESFILDLALEDSEKCSPASSAAGADVAGGPAVAAEPKL